MCRRCSAADESIRHILWECPHTFTVSDPAVTDTNHLAERALALQQWACYWNRGLVPSTMLPPISPLVSLWSLLWGEPQWHISEHVHFGTDGSGGKHSENPALRRCGWAWAACCRYTNRFLWGAYGPLPLHTAAQTVPAAEHEAFRRLLQSAPP